MTKDQLSRLLSLALTDDLLAKEYLRARPKNANPTYGHCYVASEAAYYLLGKKAKPLFLKHEGKSHWMLKDANGNIIDFTASQFNSAPDYNEAKPKGLMTKKPSKRAQKLIDRLRALDKLSTLFTPEHFERVIRTPNAKLGGKSALELILEGKHRRVMDYYRKVFTIDNLVGSVPETIAPKAVIPPILEREKTNFLAKLAEFGKRFLEQTKESP
jgi:hypothetical protein